MNFSLKSINTVLLTFLSFLSISFMGCDFSSPSSVAFDVVQLAAPANVSASKGDFTNKIAVEWDAVVDAEYYRLYYSESVDGEYHLAAGQTHITDTSYEVSFVNGVAIKGGDHFFYKVKAFSNEIAESEFSDADEGYTRIGAGTPADVTATKGTSPNTITISWTAVGDADTYKVYRSTSSSGTYAELASGLTVMTYTDTTPTPSTYYYYKVSAINVVGEGNQSNFAYGYCGSTPALIAPLGVSATDGSYNNRVVITWDTVPGATYYKLYRKKTTVNVMQIKGTESPTNHYSYVENTHFSLAIAEIQCGGNLTVLTYEDTTVNPGEYYYRVKAFNESEESSFSVYDLGYRSVTNLEFVTEYKKTEDSFKAKMLSTFSNPSYPVGYKEIEGYLDGLAVYNGSSTSSVPVTYTDYRDDYLTLNGTNTTTITSYIPVSGNTLGTSTVSGIYSGTINLHLTVNISGPNGGYYIVTQTGGSSSNINFTSLP